MRSCIQWYCLATILDRFILHDRLAMSPDIGPFKLAGFVESDPANQTPAIRDLDLGSESCDASEWQTSCMSEA